MTVYSRDSLFDLNGSNKVNVASVNNNNQQLQSVLQTQLGSQRAQQIIQAFAGGNRTNSSLLQFYVRSGMTTDFTPYF